MKASQGGGGTAKGGGKNRSGGGTVEVKKTKEFTIKAVDDSMLKLRAALYDDRGKDKDVSAGVAKSFLAFDRNGLQLDIFFKTRLTDDEVDWTFDLAQQFMEEKYDRSGYGWDDDDKMDELTEKGTRFLILRDRQTCLNVGIVHFRFTVQGEVIDEMKGAACLYVFDMLIESKYQRKGLGKHLMIILELIARREQMSRVCVPLYHGDEETKEWLTKQCKGYTLDTSFHQLGFEPDAEVSE